MNRFAALTLFALLAPVPALASSPTLTEDMLLEAFREYYSFEYRWPEAESYFSLERVMEAGRVIDYKVHLGTPLAPHETCRDAEGATVNGVPVPDGIDPANGPEMRAWYAATDLLPNPTYSHLENVVIDETRVEARPPGSDIWALYPGYRFTFEAPIRARAITTHRDTCAIEVVLLPQRIFIEGEAVLLDGLWAIEMESPLSTKDEVIFAEGAF